ncbi:hypothetical protein Tco_0833933 [Tanacetum coccineum]
MVGASHAAYTNRFHELARLVPHLVTPKSRNIERYVYGLAPQIHQDGAQWSKRTIRRMVLISGTLTDEAVRNGSIKKVEKRGNVGDPSKDKNGRDDDKSTRTGNSFDTTANPIGRENTGAWPKHKDREENRPNQGVANNEGQGRGNQGNQARGRSFMLGAEEARQDPNIITGFRLWIEIASGSSFDVIICMDWLSNHKAKILCHEKVVRIPLLDHKVLRVLGEKLEEKMRQLKSAKAKEKEQEEIVIVRDFPKVFPDDLSGLPPVQEIEFRIELIPEATPVAKSPYRLAPSELEELSGQIKKL